MTKELTAISRQFNRSSLGSYDCHAVVQRGMAGRLAPSLQSWLEGRDPTIPCNVLEIGCGTGALTEMLVKDFSFTSITALDIASKMVQVAEQRVTSRSAHELTSQTDCSASASLLFLQADVEMWVQDAPSASLDLIVSNACFQWLHHPRRTLAHLRRVLRPGGMLVFTTFGPDTFEELHKSFRAAYLASGMRPQRHGLSFQATDKWKAWLEEVGFSEIQDEREVRKEAYATVRDFLHSVKAMGASVSEAIAVEGISTRRLFAQMYAEYEDKFSIQGGIVASYDLVMIRALAEG